MSRRQRSLFVLLFFCLIGPSTKINALAIKYAICSSDGNPYYLDFWPLFAQAWKKVVGVEPVLALIANDNVQIDQRIGTVLRFAPLPNIPSGRYAQLIRLLIPVFYENDGCIISDIDMLPLSRTFFIDSVRNIPDDYFIVYHDHYVSSEQKTIPMCYVAGTGATFKSIFQINTPQDIPSKITEWIHLINRFSADEEILYKYLNEWHHKSTRYRGLSCDATMVKTHRIDRLNWHYSPDLLRAQFYHDAHLPRPLKQHYQAIKELTDLLGLSLIPLRPDAT